MPFTLTMIGLYESAISEKKRPVPLESTSREFCFDRASSPRSVLPVLLLLSAATDEREQPASDTRVQSVAGGF